MNDRLRNIDARGCAELIRGSHAIVALTGAGISTTAGIPDFRGPQGLYVTRRYDPDATFDIGAFHADPAPFFEFTRDFLGLLDGIEPTFTHHFLARLEEQDGQLGQIDLWLKELENKLVTARSNNPAEETDEQVTETTSIREYA